MLTTTHKLSAISIFPDALQAAAVLTGITNVNLNPQINTVAEATTGSAWAEFVAIHGIAPVGTFDTYSVASAGTALGLTGLSLYVNGAAQTPSPGTKFFLVKKKHGGISQADGNHLAYKCLDGLMYLDKLSVDHQGNVVSSCTYHMTSGDGTTDPLVMVESLSLPTIPRDNERYTMGPVLVQRGNSTAVELTEKTKFELDFRVKCTSRGSDSDIFNSFVSIDEIMPILRITTLKVDQLKSAGIPLTGKAIDYVTSRIYLRKRSMLTSSAYVASNVSEHIELTPYDGLMVSAQVVQAQGSNDAAAVIEIPLIGSGSTMPLAVDWTATLP